MNYEFRELKRNSWLKEIADEEDIIDIGYCSHNRQ